MTKKIIISALIFSAIMVALPLHAEVGAILPSLRVVPIFSQTICHSDLSRSEREESSEILRLRLRRRPEQREGMTVPVSDPVDTSASFNKCG